MNTLITFRQVSAALDATHQPYQVLTLQDGITIVVTQRGGRVLGPFLSPDAPSLYWINPVFGSTDDLQAYLDAGEWNLGGERFWIAPEIQYNVPDRSNFWDTIRVPAQMDPGRYTLDSPAESQVRLRMSLTMTAYNLASGDKSLEQTRVIQPIPDPLRALNGYADLIDGVRYAGYSQTATLAEAATDDILSQLWALIQVNPGGQLIIPASPHVQATDYYDPAPADVMTARDGAVRFTFTGQQQYKVGYKAAHLMGKLGYIHNLPGQQAYLIVRSYPNNPSSVYAEEPPDKPGHNGESIHVYNDNGMFGGFGEMECHGQTIGGITGRATSTDAFLLWLYVGPQDRITTLAEHLLGVPV